MQQPVLVREYSGHRDSLIHSSKTLPTASLPPIAAYAFADIVRAADGPEFRQAIEGIAEICARNRLSLAEEHDSHRPPVGEITEASSRGVVPQLRKPGMHRALTSVPEASSGSSEGSEKRKGLFSLRGKQKERAPPKPRVISLGIARTVTVEGITAMASVDENASDLVTTTKPNSSKPVVGDDASSAATTSLQRLLSILNHQPG